MKKIISLLLIITLTIGLLFTNILLVKAGSPKWDGNKYVEQEEEFRATWVSTVSNIDTTPQNGTSQQAIQKWKDNYLAILNNAISNNLNAIVFQVRPCNDAFYPSKYNPWSEYMAGFGVDPGWDPLAWMIEVTHEAGLEYHAWLNPYRASTHTLSCSITEKDQATSASYVYDYDEEQLNNYKDSYFTNLQQTLKNKNTVVDNPIMKTGEDLYYNVLYGTEGKFILNPASEEVIKHLQNTVQELVDNYNLDGIHFDDYFYPDDCSYKGTNATFKNMTFSCESKVDYADYQKYVSKVSNQEEALSIYDWRRENINTLISSLSTIIHNSNKTKNKYYCAFGISPAARYAPDESCPIRGTVNGMKGESCNNYYSYSDLYADVYKWIKSDWIDYVVPQLYTNLNFGSIGYPTGSYQKLATWWSETCEGTNCKCYIGTAAYKIQDWITAKTGDTLELYYQLRWNQKCNLDVDGYVFFTYHDLIEGSGSSYNAMQTVIKYLWKNFALTPTYANNTYTSVKTPATINEIKINADNSYTIKYNQVEDAKAYAVFADEELVKRVANSLSEITISQIDETKQYYLVTYGYDNQMAEKVTIDFNSSIENIKPVIEFNGTINQYYQAGERITGTFNIIDNDSTDFSYVLLLNDDEIETGNVTNKQVELNYKVFDLGVENYKFTLKVDDGFGEVIFETTSYQIKKESSEVEEENIDVPNDEEPTKKSGCNQSTIIIDLIMLTSLIGIIYVKKTK